ncbi:MAG: hypothetical protein ACE361_08465 [Aureliella sp.]
MESSHIRSNAELDDFSSTIRYAAAAELSVAEASAVESHFSDAFEPYSDAGVGSACPCGEADDAGTGAVWKAWFPAKFAEGAASVGMVFVTMAAPSVIRVAED